MSLKAITVALTAATLALSLTLAAPALAHRGDAVERQAERAVGQVVQTAEPRSRQTAEIGSGVFFDFNHTQTVETKRLKRRRTKR